MQNKAPKGTRDILPSETHRWHYLEAEIREVCRVFGYPEIRIPTFESTELFTRSVGETTDVVQKEMYTLPDKAGRSLTLRPEGTAGVVRAFIENGMSSLPMPVRMYYLGPMYRYENVADGRYREFRQFGCEVFGAKEPDCDVEVISILKNLFDRIGLSDTDLRINSIGCPTCRAAYHERLRAYLTPKLDRLCRDCAERFAKNPLRLFDCKEERCQAELAGAPMLLDYICDDCAAHFSGLKDGLAEAGISYQVDQEIVRGLDYYTRTVFEFASKSLATLGGAICGGGRYDGLVKLCGGQDTPGIGFAVGLDRLFLELESRGAALPEPKGPTLFLIASGERAKKQVRALVHRLRAAGHGVGMDLLGRSVKAQMKYADKLNAAFTAVIGDNEIDGGKAAVRDMKDGSVKEIALDGLFEAVCAGRLGAEKD
ncbi:MAG: histidine--tRNA ligase [Clostridiales bacterium]|jgi:histidyl-tRNA synthetase|nr:histidine--tRNA ligase [Clostridiales bacterium]